MLLKSQPVLSASTTGMCRINGMQRTFVLSSDLSLLSYVIFLVLANVAVRYDNTALTGIIAEIIAPLRRLKEVRQVKKLEW